MLFTCSLAVPPRLIGVYPPHSLEQISGVGSVYFWPRRPATFAIIARPTFNRVRWACTAFKFNPVLHDVFLLKDD